MKLNELTITIVDAESTILDIIKCAEIKEDSDSLAREFNCNIKDLTIEQILEYIEGSLKTIKQRKSN